MTIFLLARISFGTTLTAGDCFCQQEELGGLMFPIHTMAYCNHSITCMDISHFSNMIGAHETKLVFSSPLFSQLNLQDTSENSRLWMTTVEARL